MEYFYEFKNGVQCLKNYNSIDLISREWIKVHSSKSLNVNNKKKLQSEKPKKLRNF